MSLKLPDQVRATVRLRHLSLKTTIPYPGLNHHCFARAAERRQNVARGEERSERNPRPKTVGLRCRIW